ncbi:MAG: hypothetical protein IID52_07315, partial [Proteobacteria bacterium]|nr:hypothetical protein [Pseudomonadota bacterium]
MLDNRKAVGQYMVMRYLQMLWKAVGGKMIVIPTTVATLLGVFGLSFDGQFANPLFWYVVATPIVIWAVFGLVHIAVKQKDQLDLDPEDDISVRFAFQHLIVDSKWVLGKRPP